MVGIVAVATDARILPVIVMRVPYYGVYAAKSFGRPATKQKPAQSGRDLLQYSPLANPRRFNSWIACHAVLSLEFGAYDVYEY